MLRPSRALSRPTGRSLSCILKVCLVSWPTINFTLTENCVDDGGAVALADALKENNNTLKSLTIKGVASRFLFDVDVFGI